MQSHQHASKGRRKFRPHVEELEQRRLLTLLPAATTSSIGVLEDQLALLTPAPEVTFAATHCAGTQKQTSDLNQLYLNINPNWYLLHYQLGTGNSVFQYIINNSWTQDFDPAAPYFVNNPPAGPGGVTSHEDWFEHSDGSLDPSTLGNRLVNAYGLYLANIDSPGWRNYEAQTLVQNMVATGAGGVFADSFAGPTFGYYTNQGDKRYDYGGPIPGPADPSLWPNGETWLTKAANYMSYIQGQLTAAGEALYGPGGGFAYVPNGGTLTTGWADIDYSASKGLFAEGFAVWGQQITDGDWTMSMDRALRVTTTGDPANADRMFIMQPYPGATPDSADGLQQRSWAMGSYLLLKGDHTYINMLGAAVDSGLEWYPEYQVRLGAPQDPGGMPTTIAGYFDPSSQLYRRYFEHGLVLVNDTGAPQVYNLGQVMQQVIVSGWGGGVRPGDINPVTNQYIAGSLSSQLVTTVTVAPYSSVILINQGDPIQRPASPGGGQGAFPVDASPVAVSAALPLGSWDWDGGFGGTLRRQRDQTSSGTTTPPSSSPMSGGPAQPDVLDAATVLHTTGEVDGTWRAVFSAGLTDDMLASFNPEPTATEIP
jgi:hypothetical protein